MVIKDHIVNCNAYPFLPKGWKVESHQKQGELALVRKGDDLWLDDKKIDFFLSEKQKNGTVGGNDLRKELEGRPVLNANVLDFLLAHPELIPESWKVDEQGRTRLLFFWGTIYRLSYSDLCVRCLCWHGGGWFWRNIWLDNGWSVSHPAAVLASWSSEFGHLGL